jgi:hypothetical protein
MNPGRLSLTFGGTRILLGLMVPMTAVAGERPVDRAIDFTVAGVAAVRQDRSNVTVPNRADLRLDLADDATRDRDESELIFRVEADEETVQKPQPDSGKPRLTIDRFIRGEGVAPAPEADRVAHIRLCFDLTGLPPTLEDVDRFVDDPSPIAHESLVDRLLSSVVFAGQPAELLLSATESDRCRRGLGGVSRCRNNRKRPSRSSRSSNPINGRGFSNSARRL